MFPTRSMIFKVETLFWLIEGGGNYGFDVVSFVEMSPWKLC
jgi:hypothetical protein